MSGIVAVGSSLSDVVPFTSYAIPLLIAAVTFFQGTQYDPSSRPIDISPDNLEESYNFIIVGAGSAGMVLIKYIPLD